jgi:hypothetical protein
MNLAQIKTIAENNKIYRNKKKSDKVKIDDIKFVLQIKAVLYVLRRMQDFILINYNEDIARQVDEYMKKLTTAKQRHLMYSRVFLNMRGIEEKEAFEFVKEIQEEIDELDGFVALLFFSKNNLSKYIKGLEKLVREYQ